MRKKGFAGLILGWVLSTAFSGELAPVKVALDWYINPDQAPLLVADAEGFFKDEGIELTLLSPTDVARIRSDVAAQVKLANHELRQVQAKLARARLTDG